MWPEKISKPIKSFPCKMEIKLLTFGGYILKIKERKEEPEEHGVLSEWEVAISRESGRLHISAIQPL